MCKRNIPKLLIITSSFIFLFFYLSCSNNSNNNAPQLNKKSTKSIANKKDSIKFTNLNIKEPPNITHYILDTVKSRILWSIDKHNGYVKFNHGNIGISNGELFNGTFKVCMDSIVNLDIDYQLMKGTLERTLKSADFFNTAKYPYSIFKIDKTKKLDNIKYFVSGYMKIFNFIHKISLNSNIQIKKDTLIAKSQKFKIDRTKWGIDAYTKNHINNEDGFIIPNEINLIISVIAYREK